jgi:hypothetical protein
MTVVCVPNLFDSDLIAGNWRVTACLPRLVTCDPYSGALGPIAGDAVGMTTACVFRYPIEADGVRARNWREAKPP